MIIQSSAINMGSSRTYKSTSGGGMSLTVWNNKPNFKSAIAGTVKDDKESGSKQTSDYIMERFQSTRSIKGVDMKEQIKSISQIRAQTIDYLLCILFGRKFNPTEDVNELQAEEENDSSLNVVRGNYVEWNYYSEEETTSFSSTGTVKTSDGRNIDFNIGLTMSRSFVEESSKLIDFGQPICMDPLVINLDCDSACVSDQKFYFDLDGDGNEEYISRLGAGSGYLALDKNGDGVINDGTELFGTRSGNGFSELAKYDQDGNGWIDEADEIFSQLKIWTMDENGIGSLVGLGKAGVGAIYLGSSDTEFSLNNKMNSTNAIVRQTGIFLYEEGGVGTMQQLDLAT